MANEFIVKHGLISKGDITAATGELSGQSLSISDGAIIHGNFTVSGTTFTTQHETVEITDNLLIINNGEVGPGVTVSGGLAGIEVDRGSSDNYRFIFNEAADNFRVGEIGSLQAVATREDTPTDKGIPFWNSSSHSFDTNSTVKISDGYLGINTVPSYPLHIKQAPGNVSFYGEYIDIDSGGTLTGNKEHKALYINFAAMTDRNGNSYTAHGLDVFVFTSNPGDVSNLYGLSFEAQHNASNTLGSLYSIYSKSSAHNTVTNMYGVRSELFIAPGGDSNLVVNVDSYNNMNSAGKTVSSMQAFRAYLTNAAGTVTSAYLYYGYYNAGGTYGTKWGIYLSGETKSYFSGQVGIKETSPAADLDIAGTLILLNGTSINEFSTDGALAGDSDDAVPTEKAVKTYVDSNAFANRNVIINGAMDIWQRGTTTLTDPVTGTYFPDRFYTIYDLGDGTFNLLQSAETPATGFPFIYSLKADCTHVETAVGATEYAAIRYNIEGHDFKRFEGETATLSFWVKAVKTGIYCVSFINSVDDKSYVSEYTINSASTWEKKTVTLTFNSGGTFLYTTGVGLKIFWSLFCGSFFQTDADAWQDGNYLSTNNQVNGFDSTDNNFWLTGIQLELGSVATPFELRPFAQELALCQRYYQKSYIQGTFAGANTYIGSILYHVLVTIPGSVAGVLYGTTRFPVEMRTTPTLTIYNRAGTAASVYNTETGGYRGGITDLGYLSPIGFNSLIVDNTDPDALLATNHVEFQYVASAEL